MPATITGTGFAGPVKVGFSGPSIGVSAALATVGATSLAITLTAKSTAAPGTYTVTVTGANGGVAMCTGCLTVS